jgi:RND family efflux transporter MFP subunit
MGLLLVSSGFAAFSSPARADRLQTVIVTQSGAQQVIMAEGTVEAVKSSLLAPQVAGSITLLNVKAGDRVSAGQVLARIDTRIANQQAAASDAQVTAARAQLSAARQEYERKKRLYEKQYISQAALERAESDYKTAEAQTRAQLAQTGVSSVQAGLHTLTAPYAAVVAEVMVEQGDMAMPGRPLLAIYEPKALRAVVNVPQSQIASIVKGGIVKLEIPAATETERNLTALDMTILPTADAISNSVKVRLSLPQNLTTVSPGMFVRAMLPANVGNVSGNVLVPAKAVVQRSELFAVYVVDSRGEPQLRQVRLGRRQGDAFEITAGLQAGEKVALDPMAAANFKTKKLLNK